MDAGQFDELKSLLASSESRLRAELGASELRLRAEFNTLRQEMPAGFQSLRSEMYAGFARAADSFESLSDMIEDQYDETGRRLAKVEKQIR